MPRNYSYTESYNELISILSVQDGLLIVGMEDFINRIVISKAINYKQKFDLLNAIIDGKSLIQFIMQYSEKAIQQILTILTLVSGREVDAEILKTLETTQGEKYHIGLAAAQKGIFEKYIALLKKLSHEKNVPGQRLVNLLINFYILESGKKLFYSQLVELYATLNEKKLYNDLLILLLKSGAELHSVHLACGGKFSMSEFINKVELEKQAVQIQKLRLENEQLKSEIQQVQKREQTLIDKIASLAQQVEDLNNKFSGLTPPSTASFSYYSLFASPVISLATQTSDEFPSLSQEFENSEDSSSPEDNAEQFFTERYQC